MFIVFITFGFVSGSIAALITLLSGSTFFMAFVAYVLAGIAGMGAGLAWALSPRQSVAAKSAAPERGWTNL